MGANLQVILQQLEVEKSINREVLLEAIEAAIESAARKAMPENVDITVDVDPETLEFKVFEILEVTEEVEDEATQMSLEKAQNLNPNAKVGDRLKVPTEPRDFGRIATQTAKQVIIQKIKDAERENIFDEFKGREGELITGVVKRVSHGNIIVQVNRAEAVLPPREQSPRENFKPGDRIRAYLVEVERTPRGPQVVLSRSTADLVKALFDLEVPEIFDGTIEIRSIAREAGSRTKLAVVSHDANVDPVGACVGMKGSRVRAVVEELCGEKIDIVRWSENPVELCGNALNPADILDITVDEEHKEILVIVPQDQLSLAIGKRGQNARLASRLMGWNIDIKSDLELAGGVSEEGAEATSDEAAEEAPAEVAEEMTEDAAAEADTTAEAETESDDVSDAEDTASEETAEDEDKSAS